MSPKKTLTANDPGLGLPIPGGPGFPVVIVHALNRRGARGPGPTSGFTFIEILVALCIGAAVMMAGIMAYSSIVVYGPSRAKSLNVAITAAVFQNFYGANFADVSVSPAPDFTASAMAESMREKLYSDVSSSIAVFSLGRNVRSTADMRAATLAIATNFDAHTLISPEDFRVILDPGAAVFTAYSGAMTATNSSTYILARSTNSSAVTVRAIYETDMLTTTSPAGVYASVRRYEGASLTDYYHVFYPGEANTFQPLAVFFDREARATGVAANDTYKKAANRPFYFLWWPDPTVATLENRNTPETLLTTEPRAEYSPMSAKTSFFFVIPAFPAL
jgi:hypothetical protein